MTFTGVRVRGTYDDEWAWWWELACVWGSSQVWKGCTLGTAHRRQGLMSLARPPRPLHTGHSRLRDTCHRAWSSGIQNETQRWGEDSGKVKKGFVDYTARRL